MNGPPQTLSIEQQVLAEQTRLVFDRSRVSGLVKLPFAALACWMLRNTSPPALLAGWFGLLCLTTAFRVWVDRHHRHAARAEAPRSLRQFQVALFLDGLCFGMISLLPFDEPGGLTAILLMSAVIAAESVAFVVLSAHYLTLLAHVLPALMPGLVWQLAQGTETGLFIGAGGALFAALVISDGRKAVEHTRDMLRLRFQMDELAAQRAQALALAEQHSAVKGRFLATMSHEIRTPLHGVIGLARLLQNDVRGDESDTHTRHIETLRLTSEHLLSVINDTLDLSAMENQRVRLQNAAFDLTRLLREVTEVSRVTAAEKGLEVLLDSSIEERCWVSADAARLRQILLNLTGNAVKFTERGAIRIVATRVGARDTRIEVHDCGIGIHADEVEAIFEAFHRADPDRGRQHTGTGLGLAIARTLARAMGGDLTCQSRPGQGSTFTLALALEGVPEPALEEVAGTAPRPAHDVVSSAGAPTAVAAARSARRARVLLVDDNRLNAYVAEVMIRGFGLQVECVDSGAAAIERACTHAFDLVLMDCQMPGIDGFEATRQIRSHERASGLRPVPIVALTANALEADRQRSLESGMNEHLVKPFSPAELALTIERVLAADGMPRAA